MLDCFTPLGGQDGCGLANMGHEGDNCTFSCDPGCLLKGNITAEECVTTGSGSEAIPYCVPLNCTDLNTVLGYGVTVISSSCTPQYQSQCTVSCDEGFIGDDVTYLCNVTSDPTMVDWVLIGGGYMICERGLSL